MKNYILPLIILSIVIIGGLYMYSSYGIGQENEFLLYLSGTSILVTFLGAFYQGYQAKRANDRIESQEKPDLYLYFNGIQGDIENKGKGDAYNIKIYGKSKIRRGRLDVSDTENDFWSDENTINDLDRLNAGKKETFTLSDKEYNITKIEFGDYKSVKYTSKKIVPVPPPTPSIYTG